MRKLLISAVVSATALLLLAPAALAIDKVNTKKLRKEMTPGRRDLDHMRSLQRIANRQRWQSCRDHGRAMRARWSTSQRRLEAAGYKVTLDPFDFPCVEKNGPATLSSGVQDRSRDQRYGGTDFSIAQFSGAGDVTGRGLLAGNTGRASAGGAGASVSGCEPADFAGAGPDSDRADPARHVRVRRQGDENAAGRGRCAVLIFNDGFEGREEPSCSSAARLSDNTIPAGDDPNRRRRGDLRPGPERCGPLRSR